MNMPPEAFSRGIGKLKFRQKVSGVLILGFDTEYDAETQEIICYQLSDGKCHFCQSVICDNPEDPRHFVANKTLLEAFKDLTWQELAAWVQENIKKWGYSLRDYSQILLVSHFSTAELSHVENFWEEAEVRRVSAAQVYNATYRINKRQQLVVMDNYHFWNTGNNGNASLEAVAEKFGEKKVKLPEDLPINKTNRSYLSDSRFRHYALWDAVACARVFYKFRERLWSDFQIDVVQYPTSASLAMAVYRRHFLPKDFEAPDAKVRRQAWHSLWGGRAEAYRQGDFSGHWSLRDVTSLYPTSERLLEKLPRKEDWIERSEPKSWRGLARVDFSFPFIADENGHPTHNTLYPCLPVCHDGKLIFPLSGTSDCTLDEVRIALHLGAKVKYLSVFEYDDGDTSLTDFMTHFAREKAKAEAENDDGEMKDAVGRELSKLMMNSLIGKLSQNKGDVDIEEMKAFSEKIDVPLRVVMSPTFIHSDKPNSRFRIGGHVMPEWSALILGKARSIMAAMLNHVKISLICSTDSMLVPDELNPLVDEAMAAQGVVLTNKNKGKKTHLVRIVRSRVYAAIDDKGDTIFGASHAIHIGYKKRNCKDCDDKKCKDVTHNAFRFILSEESAYTKTKRNGLKTAIRKGEKFFAESEAAMTFSRAWDEKRLLLPDGTSLPWISIAHYDDCMAKRKEVLSPRRNTG